jgi:hypothetical protein
MAGKLDYWRADNAMAAAGRPDGNLGMETISLPMGQTKVFVTDWKYEKQRNDGTTYYGSHLRIAQNNGDQPVDVVVRLAGKVTRIRLQRGERRNFQHDLAEVQFPKA